jgi:putative PIN family toxin of toxin-antitoxin system
MSVLAVYDCMLYFMRAARPERFRETFELIEDGTVRVCVSAEILAEVEDVLTRPRHRHKFPALTDERVRRFLADVTARAQLLTHVPPVYELARDPKDSKYINLAVAAAAPFLVSRDKDLLDLMGGTTQESVEFRARFPDLKIVDPAKFVQAMRSAPSE